MKNYYSLLIFLLLGTVSTAQTITFGDPDFKLRLLDYGCYDSNFQPIAIDANNDNEIQVSEAEAIAIIYFGDAFGISSFDGIQYFTNLTDLTLNFATDLNSLDVSMLPNLASLWVDSSAISSLNYNPAIQSISVTNCQLTSFDTSALAGNANFTALDLNYNNLTSINLSGLATCPNLSTLVLKNNQLASLDWSPLSGNTNISEVNLINNQLTAFDFSQVNNVVNRILLENNQLASVNFTGLDQYLEALHLQDNPYDYFDTAGLAQVDTLYAGSDSLLDAKFTTYNFISVWLKGQNINSIDFRNGIYEGCFTVSHTCSFYGIGPWFNTYRNPNQIICTDDFPYFDEMAQVLQDRSERSYWSLIMNGEDEMAQDPLTGPHISAYCSDQPGGDFNTVEGNVKYDCGNTNQNLFQVPIHIIEGTAENTAITNLSGDYRLYITSSNITVVPNLEFPSYFNISPASHTFNFSSPGNTETANFCVSPNGVHHNLEISLYPTNSARPGFDAEYLIVYKNNGNQTASGTVTLDFDDAIMDFVSANPTQNGQSTHTLSWNFSNLAPFESRTINVKFNLNTPADTPAVNNGDHLLYNASVTMAETDETPADNEAVLHQVVVGSFDPNDKQVAEGSQVSITEAGQYLHYIIRFQNTGTAAAENVVIEDYLEEDLDLGTLEVQAASHPYRATLTNTNQFEVFFNNINLPASADNEPASHGFVAFKIKPKSSVAVGTQIKNKANIHFDFNFPIVTNETVTTFTVLSTQGYASENNIAIYPNPTHNVLNIKNNKTENIQSIQIHNLLGQLMYRGTQKGQQLSVDVSAFEAGNYFIRIETENAASTQHFIKR